jgi:hypothetical protein
VFATFASSAAGRRKLSWDVPQFVLPEETALKAVGRDEDVAGTCKGVTIGATRDAPGPWTITALVVGEDGQAKILRANSHHNGSLTDWLGKDVIAIGSADGYRTALPTPSSTS